MVTVRLIGTGNNRMIVWYVDGQVETMYRVGTRYMYEAWEQIRQNHPFARFA